MSELVLRLYTRSNRCLVFAQQLVVVVVVVAVGSYGVASSTAIQHAHEYTHRYTAAPED